MTEGRVPGQEERARARLRLGRALERSVPVVAVLGLVAWLIPGPMGEVAGWAVVGLLVAAPVARLVWLGRRWRRFDRRFAGAVGALLGVLVVAAALGALLRR